MSSGRSQPPEKPQKPLKRVDYAESRLSPGAVPPRFRSMPKPIKLWPFLAIGASAVCIAVYPIEQRIKFDRSDSGWALRYEYAQQVPEPQDKGLVLPKEKSTLKSLSDWWQAPPVVSPHDKPPTLSDRLPAILRRRRDNTTWILDTGATGHVCTNRAYMHSYRDLRFEFFKSGFKSANGGVDEFVGRGDVTLRVQVPRALTFKNEDLSETGTRAARVTVRGVYHYPSEGYNILSWSKLKMTAAGAGMTLRLADQEDAGLAVMLVEQGPLSAPNKERPLMKFKLQQGLYVLEQPTSQEAYGSIAEATQASLKQRLLPSQSSRSIDGST
jgi:hypothetical protein